MEPDARYRPIADYALLGNGHTCALLSREGAIDWCCLPHLESTSVFAAILDHFRGGSWRLGPIAASTSTRSYRGLTPVLDTLHSGDWGVLRVTDFLSVEGDEGGHGHTEIVRLLECLEGRAEVESVWQPRPNYARDDPEIGLEGSHAVCVAASGTFWLLHSHRDPPTVKGAAATSRFALRAGERVALIAGTGDLPDDQPLERADRALVRTLSFWDRWAARSDVEPVAGPWRNLVQRSGLVLKLLTNARTGAIAAAPTTSLPEEIGGVRNWDYRFCWVRDASMIAQAFVTLGRPEEGVEFLEFLERAAQQHHDPARVQVLYGLNGETRVTEYTLGHLDGYRDSRPVRIGNEAVNQRQLDVYGELLEAASDLLEIGARLRPQQWRWLQSVADYVCRVWTLKDRGIWEVRGPEQHFTYSKLMCWVALDRAVRIAERLGDAPGIDHWIEQRDRIREAILTQAFDADRNSFVQSFGSDQLDASSLLIPLVGFLPADDPRVQGTIDATLRELTENGLVHRYSTERTADGVGGGEGTFGICTFWLSIALALSGRVEEASEIFEGMVGRANDLGLFAEEIDPTTGEFLGNYPQAFTHVGLINAAHHLGEAIRRAEQGRSVADPSAGIPHREGWNPAPQG